MQSKKISIVQAEALPLNDVYPDSFRKDVEKRWRSRDIDFIFNDRIDQLPPDMTGTATTVKGKTITADLFVSLQFCVIPIAEAECIVM